MSEQQIQNPQGQSPQTVSIPDTFIKLGCCAFTCSNLEWPSCFGCKQAGTCLCFDGYHMACKPIQDERACCLCWAGDTECVNPQMFCKCYEQIFCFECFCALPSAEDGYRATPIAFVNMPSNEDGKGDLSAVTICSGMCCIIDSCNCDFPKCLGCYSKGVCLCLESELIRNKFMCWEENKQRPETLCICAKGNAALIMPYTCCKSIDQVCCIDRRAACPCDDDVPCVYTALPFCVCCVSGDCQVGCCKTIGEVIALRNAKYGGGMPPQQAQVVTSQPAQPVNVK